MDLTENPLAWGPSTVKAIKNRIVAHGHLDTLFSSDLLGFYLLLEEIYKDQIESLGLTVGNISILHKKLTRI